MLSLTMMFVLAAPPAKSADKVTEYLTLRKKVCVALCERGLRDRPGDKSWLRSLGQCKKMSVKPQPLSLDSSAQPGYWPEQKIHVLKSLGKGYRHCMLSSQEVVVDDSVQIGVLLVFSGVKTLERRARLTGAALEKYDVPLVVVVDLDKMIEELTKQLKEVEK